MGDGWYLQKLKEHFKDSPEVHYAGIRGGEELACLTRTRITSCSRARRIHSETSSSKRSRAEPRNRHGQRRAAGYRTRQDCGFVLPFHDKRRMARTVRGLRGTSARRKSGYAQMRESAYRRSQDFTLEISRIRAMEIFNSLGIGEKK